MEYIMTSTERVLDALYNGEELTAKQIKSRYGVANPTAMITHLRKEGHAIYLNNRKTALGTTAKYRVGTPSRRVVAAGYAVLGAEAFA
jgi:Mn-dependent DtxR family transcriptional regulator